MIKKNSNLAIHGRKPLRTKPFPGHYVIGKEEKRAISKFIDSKQDLSGFLGSWNEKFLGGKYVRKFEDKWSEFVNSKFTVSFNSNTSGLCAAIGAAGIQPGDEVIVTPYSMSATAIAIISYQGIPVFADIDDKSFCLNPIDVEKKINSRTKAIMTTAIFGHPSHMDGLLRIAKKHGLVVIEDAAQAPGSIYKNKVIGSKAHMTVFSLNVHKHIHSGEGGMVTTNYSDYAEKLRLIRNHGESVVKAKKHKDLSNSFGFNLRLTEIQALIALEQLKKLPRLLIKRIKNAEFLSSEVSKIPGITTTYVQKSCKHVYYVQPYKFDSKVIGCKRNIFIDALKKELPTSEDRPRGHLLSSGFAQPLYLLPLFQKKTAYGKNNWPFSFDDKSMSIDYSKGICPIVENIEKNEIFINDFIRPSSSLKDIKDVIDAFIKVYENRKFL